ncbi:hypothetical protein [Rhizobium sp. PEPV16]|uniref:hypothetical protein n=1 Tax=Rhizobium sp. PEPV16 TaxID=1820614 RepID=UPI0015E19E3A|nr:hypothetical protein [Rhizobium sp. PEPV16]KAF5881339.1 hypothetical protein FY112_30620 [Rhizobium sp. PEPV16]
MDELFVMAADRCLLLGGTAAIGGIVDFATGRLSLRGGMGLLYTLGNPDTRPTGRTYRRQDRGLLIADDAGETIWRVTGAP